MAIRQNLSLLTVMLLLEWLKFVGRHKKWLRWGKCSGIIPWCAFLGRETRFLLIHRTRHAHNFTSIPRHLQIAHENGIGHSVFPISASDIFHGIF